MKLFFLKDDSLYKIFKTLEKSPKKKHIQVYIETKSPFFQHSRWGKQVKELIKEKELSVTFATRSLHARKYYKDLDLPVLYLKEKTIFKFAKSVYLFFFNIKKFHLLAYSSKKSYTFYLLFFFEICIILLILYLLYGLLLPKTEIVIYPNYTVETAVYNIRYYPHDSKSFQKYTEQLSIPYYSGSTTLQHTMSIATQDVLYLHTPSKGTVRIVNKTKEPIPLLANTQLITDDGLLFLTQKFITIPAAKSGQAGYTFVKVKANDVDKQNELIGARGNIKKNTKMYIRKLKESKYMKHIYIEALSDFEGGNISQKTHISTGDIQNLQKKLEKYLDTHKLSLLRSTTLPKDSILIPLAETIHTDSSSFSYEIPKQLTGSNIAGTLKQHISYLYIHQQDLMDIFTTYIKKRTSVVNNIISMDKHSLGFINTLPSQQTGRFIITTKIDVIKGYDFDQDTNGIISSIKEAIHGKPLQDNTKGKSVEDLILAYPEISMTKIHISPPWYHSISSLQSRIFFTIKQQ